MKQCNYVVYFIDGEKVFKSARTGRVLTGSAKKACELAEERRAVREQRAIDEAVENALVLDWYAENAIEIDAEQARCEAIAKSYADASVEAVKSEEEEFEAFADAIDAIIHAEKNEAKKGIAITGWAFTATMLRNIETAYEDEDVKEAMTHTFKMLTAQFVRNSLACMGWKYKAERGTKKNAVIDFLNCRDTEKLPIFTRARYDIYSTLTAIQAVNRCMLYAMKKSENAVVADKETRPILARLCRKLIEGMRTEIEE